MYKKAVLSQGDRVMLQYVTAKLTATVAEKFRLTYTVGPM